MQSWKRKRANRPRTSQNSHSGKIDLLLTDIVMRRISGPELVSRLTVSQPQLRAVFMSGYTGELISEREWAKGRIPLFPKLAFAGWCTGALKEQAFPGGITNHG